MKQNLILLMNTYKNKGRLSGYELLLPPGEAIRLAYDLADIGVVITSAEGWRYWDIHDKQKGVIEDIAVFCDYKGDKSSPNAPKESRQIIEQFISSVPTEISFVHLRLGIPTDWWKEIFPEVAGNSKLLS